MAEALQTPTGWHRVCLNTIVRKGVELDSERLRILPMGSKVFVEEVKGRRVKISSPIVGWCSKKSSTMDTILEKILPDNGGVTPSNRNQTAKLQVLQQKAKDPEMNDVDKERHMKQIEDLQSVLAEKAKAQKQLEDEMKDLKSQLQSQVQLRIGDVVQLPEANGYGLGVVKFIGEVKDQGMLFGLKVEMGHGDSDGRVTLPDGSEGGWFAGDKCALFFNDAEKLKWLPGEKMLNKLVVLQEQLNLEHNVSDATIQKME